MLRVLLAKDCRRTWRNPLPVLINLAIPLAITALVGLTFGGKSDRGAMGRIRFAVVDEDASVLSEFLRGAANQGEGSKYLAPSFTDRQTALRQLNDNELSAVLIIPTNFMNHYLAGGEKIELELIKNPAQSVHPAVLEELLGVVATALNAIARNFQSEFPEWRRVFEGESDYKQIATLVERAGTKLEKAEIFFRPPLITYTKETYRESSSDVSGPAAATKNPASDLFGYLMTGMTGLFLLFLASNAMADLHREIQLRTLARYHTLHHSLAPFIAGKMVYTMVLLLSCSAFLLIGGGWIFGVTWHHPLPLVGLVILYSGFAAGLMAVLVALITDERKAGALNTLVAMGLGLAGGCMFPPRALPGFIRDHVTPWLPTHWFVDTVRNLEYGGAETHWMSAAIKLMAAGATMLALAALLFRRQLRKGTRP